MKRILFLMLLISQSCFGYLNAFDQPKVSKKTVLIYNKKFAERFHLDPKQARELTPGVMAISMTFTQYFSLFSDRHGLYKIAGRSADFTHYEYKELIESDVNALYSIFPLENLHKSYLLKIYIGLYLDMEDSEIKELISDDLFFHKNILLSSNGVVSLAHFDDKAFGEVDDKERGIRDEKAKIISAADRYMAPIGSTGQWRKIYIAKSKKDFINKKVLRLGIHSQSIDLIPGIAYMNLGPIISPEFEKYSSRKEAKLFLIKKYDKSKLSATPDDYFVVNLPHHFVYNDTLRDFLIEGDNNMKKEFELMGVNMYDFIRSYYGAFVGLFTTFRRCLPF